MKIVFEITVEDIKRYLVNQTFRVNRDVEKHCFDKYDYVGRYAKGEGENKLYMSSEGVFKYDAFRDIKNYIAHVTDYSGDSDILRKLQPHPDDKYLEVIIYPQQYWGEDFFMAYVCWFKWECPELNIEGEYCKELLVCKKLVNKITGRDDDSFELSYIEC